MCLCDRPLYSLVDGNYGEIVKEANTDYLTTQGCSPNSSHNIKGRVKQRDLFIAHSVWACLKMMFYKPSEKVE